MKVAVGNEIELSITVGDILEFNHKGTAGEHGYYLVCKSRSDGIFIMNLSGQKGKIVYYDSVSLLYKRHKDSIVAVYPAAEFQIKLERV